MSITSLGFLLFLLAVLILYYIVSGKYQWCVLLAASAVFYLSCGARSALYVLVTSSTVYAATLLMYRLSYRQKEYLKEHKGKITKEEKAAFTSGCKKRRKAVMLTALLINIGILCVFKYLRFAVEQINGIIGIFGGKELSDSFSLIAPLGISFYTFQTVGYLLDIYWEYYEPERNYLKVLLFVSFFPQMTQGPISEFPVLTGELFSPHSFEYRNFSRGFQRMLWGFVKKLLIADILAPCVGDVFANYSLYSGITVLLGAFLYSVQIYADFSGYMDIMCGLCEMLGIRLTENFERPYFAKSIAEYWRRWHITLGVWFKKYIYYPIGMSGWSRKLAKNSREKFGKHFANSMPATIALVVTWLATGLWHGASWSYIAWGLVNGLFIIFSLWMEPVYESCRITMKVDRSQVLWRLFQTVRTFILVTFIKVLPEVGTLRDGWGLWVRVFSCSTVPTDLHELMPYLAEYVTVTKLAIAAGFTVLLFVFSLIQHRRPVRDYFNRLPMPMRAAVMALAVILIAGFGSQAGAGAGGFMYANF